MEPSPDDVQVRAEQLYAQAPVRPWASFAEVPLAERERYEQLAYQQLRSR